MIFSKFTFKTYGLKNLSYFNFERHSINFEQYNDIHGYVERKCTGFRERKKWFKIQLHSFQEI